MKSLRANNISQFIQIFIGEIPIISITSLHILFNSMQIQSECFQQLALEKQPKISIKFTLRQTISVNKTLNYSLTL